ncbi:hypothetical protein F5J12DRAFT_808218 [Pisolithus orientalis]|uniref:uncharacterized protein n=1 Tax=Pisolithus orientalis TaxID=936130 RepID=UPI002223F0BB|nr:uncharacterized protein F5J12DRAFT_808218 [Pisolithus orientalis]KAI6028862.1 hypothetical protein F5J12DRAFT_808218 [Pisolithus orientalis]
MGKSTISEGIVPGSPKRCVKQLVMMLLQAMKGVTHAFQMRQSSRVVEMMYMTNPIMTTLGAEFLADISTTFLGAKDILDDVKSADRRERNNCETKHCSIQSLVDEIMALQTQYHKSKDDVERLALEQDIVGTILLACYYGISSEIQQTIRQVTDDVLRYETTDTSMALPERKERLNCLHFVGDIFEDAFSGAPLDNHFHLRWYVHHEQSNLRSSYEASIRVHFLIKPMANAKARTSMHKLYLATRSGWDVRGTGSIQLDSQGSFPGDT